MGEYGSPSYYVLQINKIVKNIIEKEEYVGIDLHQLAQRLTVPLTSHHDQGCPAQDKVDGLRCAVL